MRVFDVKTYQKTDIIEYLDQLTFDYTQLCQRDDGTIYGIASGKLCRRGKPIAYNPNDERHRRIAFNQKLKKPRAIARLLIGKFKKLGGNKSTVRKAKNQTVEDIKSGKAKGEGIFKTFGRKLDNLKSKISGKSTKKSDRPLSSEVERLSRFTLDGFTRTKAIDQRANKLLNKKDSQKIKDKLAKAVREGKITSKEALDTYERRIERLESNIDSLRRNFYSNQEKGLTSRRREEVRRSVGEKDWERIVEREKLIKERRRELLQNSPKYNETPGSKEAIPRMTPEELKQVGQKVLNEYPDLKNDELIERYMSGIGSPTLPVIYSLQGYNSRPELVDSTSDLLKRSDLLKGSDGINLILYRGSSVEFTDQFLGAGVNGEFHGPGRGIYGNGTYSATSLKNNSRDLDVARTVAKSYSRGRGGGEEPVDRLDRVVSFSIRADSEYRQFPDEKSFRKWEKETLKKAKQVTGIKFDDIGYAAAALGIHAYNIPDAGSLGSDYWVILNRGALVVSAEPFVG